MKPCCEKTTGNIERAFNEGIRAFETDDGRGSEVAALTQNPYTKRKPTEKQWWERGYAYQARLYRALKSETRNG